MSYDKNAGAVKVAGTWTKCCISCVAQSVGDKIRRGINPPQIVKSVDFRCCNHRKKEGAGCRTCLADVKRIIRRLWFAYDIEALMVLLTQANKPDKTLDSSRKIATEPTGAAAVEHRLRRTVCADSE